MKNFRFWKIQIFTYENKFLLNFQIVVIFFYKTHYWNYLSRKSICFNKIIRQIHLQKSLFSLPKFTVEGIICYHITIINNLFNYILLNSCQLSVCFVLFFSYLLLFHFCYFVIINLYKLTRQIDIFVKIDIQHLEIIKYKCSRENK